MLPNRPNRSRNRPALSPNKLSVSVRTVIIVNSCAQTQIMLAIRILRSRGMVDAQLQQLLVWLSQNLYASIAPDGVLPLHRTGNALKVFYVAAVGKTCTLLTNPL